MPQKFLFAAPCLIITGFASLRFWNWVYYDAFVQEDGIVEYLQAVFYFLGGVCACWLSRHSFRSKSREFGFLFLAAGALFFFVAFEEISWGQRILGVETPDFIARVNTQEELTLHNLAPVQRWLHKLYMLAGLYGMLGWMIYPLLVKRLPMLPIHRFGLFVIPARYFFFFFPAWAFYFVYDFLDRDLVGLTEIHFLDLEIAEFLLALGAFLYLYEIVRARRKELPRFTLGAPYV